MENTAVLEKPNTDLLNNINNKLKEISLGENARYLHNITELPEIPDIAKETLKNEKILMVDDMPITFYEFLPTLITATDGNASGIMSIGDRYTKEKLAKEIFENNPSILLMDNNIQASFNGPEVVSLLRSMGFTGKIIGFSTNYQSEDEFIKKGANGFLIKDLTPEEIVLILTNYSRKH